MDMGDKIFLHHLFLWDGKEKAKNWCKINLANIKKETHSLWNRRQDPSAKNRRTECSLDYLKSWGIFRILNVQ